MQTLYTASNLFWRQKCLQNSRQLISSLLFIENIGSELSPGVTMIKSGDKARPARAHSDKDLRPMKLMQNTPLDHAAIVHEATY